MRTSGLSLDQAPPLAVPAGFFACAPVALVLAGLALLRFGSAALTTPWAPATFGLTHLGTLALLGSVMLGAVYQMVPVVVGGRVPGIKLAYGVWACWVSGVLALVWGLLGPSPGAAFAGITLLGPALLGFVVPVAWALVKASSTSTTARGMRLAVLAFFTIAMLGLYMAHGHTGHRFPGARPLFIRVHLALAFAGWVGGLLSAVSWQVVPMFFLAKPVDERVQRLVLGGTAAAFLPLAALVTGSDDHAVLLAVPAVLAVLVVHPAVTLRSIAVRTRKRSDASLRAWQAGLVCAFPTALLLVPAHLSADPRWALAAGWLGILGWAGLVMHGMLTRILPFLIWFHRFSPLAGKQKIPSMKDLLPNRRAGVGLVLQGAALLAGLVAIGARSSLAAQLAGLLLIGTGAWIAAWMVALLQRFPEAPAT